MVFSVNTSPFAGREGEFVTSHHLRERLFKEVKTNVAMRLEETESPDSYIVKGRGELHLSILIETMRREGYELQVGKPKVITHRDEEGNLLEPMEALTIDVPQDFMGAVMEGLGCVSRAAEHDRNGRLPAYGIFNSGARPYRLPQPVLNRYQRQRHYEHVFAGYAPYKAIFRAVPAAACCF